MSTPTEEARYHINVHGIEDGPFRLSELLEEGVDPDTPVWVSGSADWRPAHEVPEVARFLDDHWQRRHKASRKAQDLPDPAIFRKLRLANLVIEGPAALLTVTGTTALLTALVLKLTAHRGAALAMVIGLVPTILGLGLLLVEAGVVAACIISCARVIKVLAPGKHGDDRISWRDWLQWDLGGTVSANAPTVGVIFLHLFSGGGNVLGLLLLTLLIFLPALVVFCAATIVFIPILVVLLPVYAPFGLAIYRLGYGLDCVVDRYRLRDHGVPWAPIKLGFFTALCGLFVLAGPLAVAFFIVLPIWVHRTARTAEAICRTDPAHFVKRKRPPKVPDELSSPFDLPSNPATPS